VGIADIAAADMTATFFDADAPETPVESVTYTTVAGAETTVSAGWSEPPASVGEGQLGRAGRRTAVMIVAASDIAAPAVNDTATRAATSELWTVTDVEPIGAGAAFALTLKRAEPTERARESYRVRPF